RLTPALAALLSKNADRHVIVLMKSQPRAAKVGSQAAVLRSGLIAENQAPVLTELKKVHATHVKSYKLVNALAATVSGGEIARLKANAAVAKVIPDVVIHGAQPLSPAQGAATSKNVSANDLTPNVLPGACSSGAPQLDPEGLSLTNTDSDQASQKTARSLGI